MEHLGASLSNDGKMSAELNRRIGSARGDFRALTKVWRHSTLNRDRKLKVFSSLIESKLFYGLPSGCLSASDSRRLDGFQCRCLRQILGIPPAFLSRVSNECVFQAAAQTRASVLLQQRQLSLLGDVLRAPQTDPISYLSFTPGTAQPAVSRYARRVGRPHKEWVPTVLQKVYSLTGGHSKLAEQCLDERGWKQFIREAVRH